MPTPVPSDSLRSLATASADRISALLDYYLGNGMLFDALHALSILEGVKAPITLTELASQYTRRIRTAPMVSGQISLHELLLRYAATLAKDQASSYRGYKEAAMLAARFLGEDFLAEELTRQDLLGMLDRYAPGASRNGVLIRFRTALRWGVREHLISNQVAEDLRPGPERYKQPAFFKPDRVERIMRRNRLSRQEAEALVDMIPTVKATAYNEKNLGLLRNHYQECLGTFNCEDLVEMTMSIYAKKQDAARQQKKFGVTDEKYLRRAEELLFGELAVALEIPREDVQAYITCRLKK